MHNDLLLYAAVPIVGFVAGFINTLAGSGSLLTLPLLIVLGLPPTVANGTNRVGILVQTIVSVATFRKRRALESASVPLVLIPAVIGAAVGAALAVDLDERVLQRTIGVLMLVLLATLLFNPQRFLEERAAGDARRPFIQVPVFFAIGVYGGFIQAGVGLFLLAGLTLAAGHDLVRGNAVKNLVVLVFTFAALAVFVFNGQVDWSLGALLAAGSAGGAWVATHMAVRRGAAFVRYMLIATLVASSIALLGDFTLR